MPEHITRMTGPAWRRNEKKKNTRCHRQQERRVCHEMTKDVAEVMEPIDWRFEVDQGALEPRRHRPADDFDIKAVLVGWAD